MILYPFPITIKNRPIDAVIDREMGLRSQLAGLGERVAKGRIIRRVSRATENPNSGICGVRHFVK